MGFSSTRSGPSSRPAYVDGFKALRHPGYNVAYWNLAQRRVSRREGEWVVNGEPLRFVHFSGNVIEDETVFSRHSQQFGVDNLGPFRELLDEYRSEVVAHGHDFYRSIPYAFDRGLPNAHTPQSVFDARSTVSPSPKLLPLTEWATKGERDEWAQRNDSVLQARREVESHAIPRDRVFDLSGYCRFCDAPRRFRTGPMYAKAKLPDGRTVPNWREHLACTECGFVTRIRGTYHVLTQEIAPAPDAAIYTTEMVTNFFTRMRDRYPALVGSEFIRPDLKPGTLVNGMRHEDVQHLSFGADQFDVVVSMDVLEHVPDHKSAMGELCRVLRPGGALVLTVPFDLSRQQHETRAYIDESGELHHLMEPEMHGNPMSPEAGSLSYRTFGWEILDDLKGAGFTRAHVVEYWSREMLYFGEGICFVARKS